MRLFKRYKTIEELLPGFLLEREILTKAKNAQAYNHHCYVFIEWLKAEKLYHLPLRKIDNEIIARFFRYIATEKELDRPTCEKYLLHLKLFFQYALKRDEIKKVPFDFVILPQKGVDKSAEVIHADHLKPLLEEIRRIDPQLFLACMIEYYCFIRPGRELRLLKVGDVDVIQGTITVLQDHAKNNKRQVVTIPNQLMELFYSYGVDMADKNLYIFGNKKCFGTKPVSINMLRYRFNKIRDRLEMPIGYKLYSFKHTGATNLHLAGVSIREIMDQLRHTKLETTQHYVKTRMGIINPKIRDYFPNPLI